MTAMPVASAGPVVIPPIVVPHYWPRHRDGYVAVGNPPVLNQWYTVIDELDVAITWLTLRQNNTENAAKNLGVRFTVDGVVYQTTFSVPAASDQYIYRHPYRSVDTPPGLAMDAVMRNAGYTTQWRAQAFKFEARITSPLGTAQLLVARAVPELDLVT